MRPKFVMRKPRGQLLIGAVDILFCVWCAVYATADVPDNIVWARIGFGVFIALGLYITFDVLLWRVEAYETEFVVRNWLGQTRQVPYAQVRAVARRAFLESVNVLDADGKPLFRIDHYARNMDKLEMLAVEQKWQLEAAAQRRMKKDIDIWDFEARPNYVFLFLGIPAIFAGFSLPLLPFSVPYLDAIDRQTFVLCCFLAVLLGLLCIHYYFCKCVKVNANIFTYRTFLGRKRQCTLEEIDYVRILSGDEPRAIRFFVKGKGSFVVGKRFLDMM